MNSDAVAQGVAAVMMLVLVGSSLAARRVPLATGAKMALAWVAIFACVFVLFLFRGEARAVWDRVAAELAGAAPQTVGQETRVTMADDGSFYIDGRVNGHAVRFLVDSGASTTALSAATAEACGVVADSTIPTIINTANGTVSASTARIGELSIGSIVQRDAAVVVSPAFGEVNALGMSFLSSLKRWRVEGRTLILEPKAI